MKMGNDVKFYSITAESKDTNYKGCVRNLQLSRPLISLTVSVDVKHHVYLPQLFKENVSRVKAVCTRVHSSKCNTGQETLRQCAN